MTDHYTARSLGQLPVSSSGTITLDDFIPKPLTGRTEKFMQLCDFYRNATGKYSHSSYTMFEVIHDHSLSFGLRHFKLLSENQVITVFWKWERIMGIPKVRA